MAPFARTNTFTSYTKITAAGHNQNWSGLESFLNAVTFPASGTLATLAGSETLTNKTLTAPIIATISNSGTLTLPTGAETLVGRATTDTLTNKTINGSNNTITNVSLTTGVTGTLPAANGGTGQASYNSGEILYASAATTLSRLAAGTAGQRLKVSGVSSQPTWGWDSTNIVSANDSPTTLTDGVIMDATGGNKTVTLPTTPAAGKRIRVMKSYVDTSANTVTINRGGSDTIQGDNSYVLYTSGEAVELVFDGTSLWYVYEHFIPSRWVSFTGGGSLATNTTYDGCFYQRVGDTINVKMRVAFSGDPGTYSSVTVTVPNSWTIDTAKLPNTTNLMLGTVSIKRAGALYQGVVLYNNTTSAFLFASQQTGTAVDYASITDSFPNATDFANNDYIHVEYSVPITGFKG